MKLEQAVIAIQKHQGIVGRSEELKSLIVAISAQKHVLIEGPVGVGKTVLAQAAAAELGKRVIRIDGDSRFTEQKLTGWFDPAVVMKKGYNVKCFIDGPLTKAMREGSILLINELNRMPEAVQNVLLPALDEGWLQIPQLDAVRAKQGFLVIATQNPREFVATSHLSEALQDRLEWLSLAYQSFDEEIEIVRRAVSKATDPYLHWAVALVRATRSHAKIKRGASVRAAIAIVELAMVPTRVGQDPEAIFWDSVRMALPTRIELQAAEVETSGDGVFSQQVGLVLHELWQTIKDQKKNN